MCLFIMSLFLQTNFPPRFFAFFRPIAARWIKQKMFQKSSKILPKIIHNFVLKNLGPIRYPILGASWGRLGAFWDVLGYLGDILMHLVAVLEASWGVLGASWVENGGQHGSNLAPKTEPKSRKDRSKKRSKF